MKKLTKMKLIAMIATIAILASTSSDGASPAVFEPQPKFSGIVYLGAGTSTPVQGAAITAKNLTTGKLFFITSGEGGAYTVNVAVGAGGSDFFIKATKSIGGFGYADEATLWNAGGRTDVIHDFHLTPAD